MVNRICDWPTDFTILCVCPRIPINGTTFTEVTAGEVSFQRSGKWRRQEVRDHATEYEITVIFKN